MKKVYWIKCNRSRKFKKPKISNIFDKTFLLFVVRGAVIMKKIFKEEESIEISKVLSFIINMEKYQMSI